MGQASANGFHSIRLSRRSGIPVTVLLPRNVREILMVYLARRGSPPANLLQFALRKYGPILRTGILPVHKGTRKLYQRDGMNLVRFDFRVSEQDWAVLTEIAHGMGLSRCLVFTALVETELLGPDVVVPTPSARHRHRSYRWTAISIMDTHNGILHRKLRRDPVFERWELWR